MKKLIFTLLICLVTTGLTFAQAPATFKYQAVVRDISGNIIPTQVVKFRITLLKGSPTGTESYKEQHTTATNQFGIANLEIGTGSSQVGVIDTIQWGKADYFIKIELDPTGSSGYSNMGTTQLMSVPYALYANKSQKSMNDNDTSATNEIQSLSINGSNLTISGSNTVTLPTPQMPSGCIMAYGGTTAPSGWLLCDGSAVSRTTYAGLYAIIGNAYGSGDGTTTFNLPDFRGRFLRGVDGTAGNDPDKATRTASNSGGNTGNNIGSLQQDDFKSHNHNLKFNVNLDGTVFATTNNYLARTTYQEDHYWTTNTASLVENTVVIASKGGNETRPNNVYVNYIIKY